ncbi:triose-phosphate transporter family-domain-containing protein [Gaertneriomyces semiglobifer]|nr:triose-phosphate transporter family-domain-containing protein [Gaertneriomyces semiglobifer]
MGAATMHDGKDDTSNERLLPLLNGVSDVNSQPKSSLFSRVAGLAANQLHPAYYICLWIAFSSAVDLLDKRILFSAGFPFPIFLATCQLTFATITTRMLSFSTTTRLARNTQDINMTWSMWAQLIVPIGATSSLSLLFSNLAYSYLSVAVVQMFKATTPVAVLVIGYVLRVTKTDRRAFLKVILIVFGVTIASYGAFDIVPISVTFQTLGVLSEATRLILLQKLLSQDKMDPLTSLYYFAPVCAALNGITCLVVEGKYLSTGAILDVGVLTLLGNATVAFGLLVAVVLLIARTSSIVLCLSGVLQDIIVVAASLLIRSTTVTSLQCFGYAIALAGLVWYKEPAALTPIRDCIRKKQSKSRGKQIFALIILVNLLVGLVGSLAYISHSKAVVPVEEDGSHLREDRDEVQLPPKLGSTLDIVISSYDEHSKVMKNTITALTSHPAIASRKPRIILYSKHPKRSPEYLQKATGADIVLQLPNRGRESATYLWHLLSQYDALAKHTLFIQAKPHVFFDGEKMAKWVSDRLLRFEENVGFLTLGPTHILPLRDINLLARWPRIGQTLSAVTGGEILPDNVAISYTGQFIVSRDRVRHRSRSIYRYILDLLQADEQHWIHQESPKWFGKSTPSNPFFGHYVERSYHAMFDCMNVEMIREGCYKGKLCGCYDT